MSCWHPSTTVVRATERGLARRFTSSAIRMVGESRYTWRWRGPRKSRVWCELTEYLRGRNQPMPGSHLDRVMRTKRVSHTADYAAEGVASPAVTLGGARSTVDVPMLKDNELIGVMSIYRQEVRPFTNKQ